MQKIFKTGTILFWEKHVFVQLSKQLPKRSLSIATPKLDETMDQSETLLCSSPKNPPLSAKVSDLPRLTNTKTKPKTKPATQH